VSRVNQLKGEFVAVEIMLMHMSLEKVLAFARDREDLRAMNGEDVSPASFADTIPAPAPGPGPTASTVNVKGSAHVQVG